jgi:hypothetical protein
MAEPPRFRRNPAIGATVVDEETFLIEPESQEVFYLDAVSSALWRLLAEPRSAVEMAALFAAAFPDQASDAIARDLAAVTADLLARGLVSIVPEDESPD